MVPPQPRHNNTFLTIHSQSRQQTFIKKATSPPLRHFKLHGPRPWGGGEKSPQICQLCTPQKNNWIQTALGLPRRSSVYNAALLTAPSNPNLFSPWLRHSRHGPFYNCNPPPLPLLAGGYLPDIPPPPRRSISRVGLALLRTSDKWQGGGGKDICIGCGKWNDCLFPPLFGICFGPVVAAAEKHGFD